MSDYEEIGLTDEERKFLHLFFTDMHQTVPKKQPLLLSHFIKKFIKRIFLRD